MGRIKWGCATLHMHLGNLYIRIRKTMYKERVKCKVLKVHYKVHEVQMWCALRCTCTCKPRGVHGSKGVISRGHGGVCVSERRES